ncbi:MAG: hypothetical protein WC761_01150 [Candidatus Paceibacterota bacterium]|jgi:hypothetical protein
MKHKTKDKFMWVTAAVWLETLFMTELREATGFMTFVAVIMWLLVTVFIIFSCPFGKS